MLATVYRPVTRNEHGDPADQNGAIIRLSGDSTARLGTVEVIVGGASGNYRTVRDAGLRGEVISTDGMLGFRAEGLELRAGDIVEAAGQRWEINGPVLWGRPHSLTGSPSRWKWIAAIAN